MAHVCTHACRWGWYLRHRSDSTLPTCLQRKLSNGMLFGMEHKDFGRLVAPLQT